MSKIIVIDGVIPLVTNLLQELKEAGLKMRALKTEQNSLEKIFVTLVKENNEI